MQNGTHKTCLIYPSSIITRHINRIHAVEKGVRISSDIEYLHVMRVESRRLLNAFWIFKKIFPKKHFIAWRNYIRETAKMLGQARDLDTQIEFIKKFTTSNPEHKKGIEKIIATFQQQRHQLQPRVIAILDRLKQKNTLADIKKYLKTPRRYSKTEMYSLAETKLRKRLKQLLCYQRYVANPKKEKQLHHMRIAAKHLRYTLETFHPLAVKQIEAFIDIARTIQAMLGDVHGFDVWIEKLPLLCKGKDKELSAAINFFLKECRSLRKQSYYSFVHYWDTLKRKKTWKKLTEYIDSLPNKL